MSRLTKAAAAMALAVTFAAVPAGAQQAVQEPGAASFYHPDAGVLHAGAPAPAATPRAPGDAMAQMRASLRTHRAGHGAARRE